MLLKTDDSVKTKAMIKYKEIISKGNENGKAQQYLDALLSIPFGVYIKEHIFYAIDDIKEEINLYLEQQKDKTDIINIIETDKSIETRYDIDNFFIKINEHDNLNNLKKLDKLFTSLKN